MKLAITGKGGVGKTTISSLFCLAFASLGREVIAIDANPDSNLGIALGFDKSDIERLIPIVELKDVIKDRTTMGKNSIDGFFKLNPRVDDLPDKYSIRKGKIRLLSMGTVKRGGGGCLCPESTFLKSLLSHIVLNRQETAVLDMDAGLENLGRGTAQAVDAIIIVVEAGQRSFQSAESIVKLAKDLGINQCYAIGSKTKNQDDRDFINHHLMDLKLLGFINYNEEIAQADKAGKGIAGVNSIAGSEINEIITKLEGAEAQT